MSSPNPLLALARWLGPWADERALPPDIVRQTAWAEGADGERVQVWVYRGPWEPKEAAGVYVLAPGLHYAGPADPRLDRFARVLAASGFWVVAPLIEGYLRQRVSADAADDMAAVWRWVAAQPRWDGLWIGVFSISFGSLLALRVAAEDGERRRIGRLLIFGGYYDWREAMRFCATGEVDGVKVASHDPLNMPVLMLHVLEVLCPDPDGQRVLSDAWGRFMRATWGRPEMKAGGWRAVAQALVAEVPAPWRDLFSIGCGLTPGAAPLLAAAMTQAPWLEALDPTPYIARVRCPVTLFHGSGDDVIPASSLWGLRDALAPVTAVEALLTGSYGHTGRHGGLTQALSEARTTARLLWRMAGR